MFVHPSVHRSAGPLVRNLIHSFVGMSCSFLGSGPVGDDDLWYHHIPGTLRFYFYFYFYFSPSPPTGASHLALGPSKLALRPSQLALRPSQLALRPPQLALRPPIWLQGSPCLIRGPPSAAASSEDLIACLGTLPTGSKALLA